MALLCATSPIPSHAQTFTTLVTFNGTFNPSYKDLHNYASLIQDADGDLFGITFEGGTSNLGTVFKITPVGALTALHEFSGSDGALPTGGLVQGTDGSFYGMTVTGGTNNYGTIFKITTEGTLTTVHDFNGVDGDNGYDTSGPLVQATDGSFYGTTFVGGYVGNVFKLTPDGTLTNLHSFTGSDGANPFGGLIQAADGNLYGTTHGSYGTVFKITLEGALTTLHTFTLANNVSEGGGPAAGLVQAEDGNLYGSTAEGGANNAGTIFKITPLGVFSVLTSISGTPGSGPEAALIQASDGNLYGTTAGDFDNGNLGTVFKITPGGILTTLHNFNGTDGASPSGALVQASDGSPYGTTALGGINTMFDCSIDPRCRGTLF